MNKHTLLLMLPLIMLGACTAPDSVKEKPAPTIAGKEESLLRIAMATEAAGDTNAALQLYRQVASNNPDSVEAWIGQARLYNAAGQAEEAIVAFENALAHDPDNSGLIRELANLLIYNGNPEQALKYLDSALLLSPADSHILNAKGVALDMQGRYSEAQSSFRDALKKESGSKSYIENNLAMSYLLSGEYDKSISLLRKLIATQKDDIRLRQNLALAYGLKGDHKKALKLGLKDLPPDVAEENIDFYKAYSKRVGKLEPSAGNADIATTKPQPSLPETTPASVPEIADTIPDTPDAPAITETVSADDSGNEFTVEDH